MQEKNNGNITLRFFDLPLISSLDELSNYLRISKQLIYTLTIYQDSWYKTYYIKKKTGGSRLIAQPSSTLKAVQAWILHNVLYKVKSSTYSTAYDIGTSIKTNVQIHQGSTSVLIIDLKDFFNTIDEKRVYNLFRKIGYNVLIAKIFTKLCTYNGSLPQGGVCSGKIANLISWKLDSRISGFCSKRGLNFSRYADDLTISGFLSKNVKKTIPTIYSIIKSEEFKVNYKKTRVLDSSCNRTITGLTLYQDTFGIGSESKRKIRAAIFNFLTKNRFHTEQMSNQINGWFNYLNSVDRNRQQQLIEYTSRIISSDKFTILNSFNIKFRKSSKLNVRQKIALKVTEK